ncbi:MAG: histidine kinase [Acidobacteria bacterium]|nr:histidine kinase [Acidobacteriota bacterium]
MKPPSDRLLDFSGAGTDLPLPPRPSCGLRWPVVVLGAAGVAVASSTLAWKLSISFGPSLSEFRWILIINSVYAFLTLAAGNVALRYYRESRERALRASQLETRLVAAQLKTLQQQLHPHFLFNTLHAISALMHSDIDAADRTLIRLSDLLRLSLERLGQQEGTLDAELEFLRKYLEIERTRFADRLVVRYDIQADALDALVPTLILQPLVENALKHGVGRKPGAGHIDITARRDHDMLWLEVRDDGVGLSEDALTALQKGIGVSTTRARLQQQFGAEYRLEFHRIPQGVAVVVAVPWRISAGVGTVNVEGIPHEETAHTDRRRRAAGKGAAGEPAFGRTGC